MEPDKTRDWNWIYERLKSNKSWYNKSYSGRPIGLYEQGLAITREAISNPLAISYGLFFQNYKEKDHLDWFWDVDDMKEKRRLILEKLKSDPQFSDQVLREGEINHDKFVAYNSEIDSLDLSTASNEELKTTFEKLHDLLIEISVWSYAVDAFLSDGEEDWLEILIKKSLGDAATQEVIETLTLPTFASFVNEAEALFLKIVNEFKKGNQSEAEKLALEYQNKYFWIRTNYKEYKRVFCPQILTEAKDWLVKNPAKNVDGLIVEDESRISENIHKKKELYSLLSISEELQSALRFSEVFTHLQDNRKERVLRMNTLFYEFIGETEKRFKIQDPLGFYMTHKELFGLYDGEMINMKEVQDRYDEGFLLIFYNDICKIITAAEYKKEGIDKNFFTTHDNVSEFKGTVAFRGVVKGIARVLKNAQEIATFNEGEILVANQTTPEYVPAMKKAIAIVTDQGGITCHAAIVARELRIPAVIGTKIATKVLKDGDMVEVDAEKGIITIIK